MATISWNAATSADWAVVADWAGGVLPGTADTALLASTGAYPVTIASTESFAIGALAQQSGRLSLLGVLDIATASTIAAGAVLDGGGTFLQTGMLQGAGGLTNSGLVIADSSGNTLMISTATFTNQGTLSAANQAIAYIYAGTFTNFSAGTLTGGSYVVSGSGAAINLFDPSGASAEIVTDAAAITLDGPGAAFIGFKTVGTSTSSASLEASLTSIAAGGVLAVLGGRDYSTTNALGIAGALQLAGGTVAAGGLTLASGGRIEGYGTIATTIANGGLVDAHGGVLDLAAGLSGAGALQVDANAFLALAGAIGQPILDNGTVQAVSGTLSLSGTITGSGGFLVQGGSAGAVTTLDLASAVSGAVAFNGAYGALRLESPAGFSGAIIGFGTGDTIELVGAVATGATLNGGTLSILNGSSTIDTLSLSGNYAGASFTAATSGGVAMITASGIAPRDYVLEGPSWHSKTITWSLATTTYAGDTANAFSSTIDPAAQSAYVSVIEQALGIWSSYSGITFVQQADATTVAGAADIRIGWGDLISSGGEIGQSAYSYLGDQMQTDSIVRLEDPAQVALVASPTVTGGYTYSGYSSTLYQVAVHELGHALGLGHSTDPNAVMYPTAQGVTNQAPDASDIAGIQALYAAVSCYAAGTAILTASGEVAVEALRVGDRVAGLDAGALLRVRWIGRRRLDPSRHARPQDVQPITVQAGAFAPGMPRRDLRLSPDHAVFVDGVLVPVRYLVNGATIRRETVRDVTYFHVELEDAAGRIVHDVLLAEGMPAESFLDTGARAAFGGAATQLHPDFAARLWDRAACAPLHVGGPRVAAIRHAVLARADLLGFGRDRNPALEAEIDGRVFPPAAQAGLRYMFALPAGRAVLRSRTAIPAENGATDTDTRCLGVAVAALAIDGRGLDLDDPCLGAGFFPIEHAGDSAWRWTDGAAVLHLTAPARLEVTLAATLPYWVPRGSERRGPQPRRSLL
ncbi:MAG: Hint domain-containing protein [Rhodospirillales bacterium]|nr:Hint domain-containing protein [Rhodospirillales bacterium]